MRVDYIKGFSFYLGDRRGEIAERGLYVYPGTPMGSFAERN